MVSGPNWIDPNDPPDHLPVVKMSTPDYPERLNGSTEMGYRVVDSFIYEQGKYSIMQCIGTNPLFYEAITTADPWRVEPAIRDGQPVNSVVRHAS